jgi:hypothetical protein
MLRSSRIGISLLDLSSVTRAAHPSRRTAASTAVRKTSPTVNHNLFDLNENLQLREGRSNLTGRSTLEVTL